jgi:putative hydrolase of the HAD superfamily
MPNGMKLDSIRAVFFDAVGTLIHPDPPAPVAYARIGGGFGSRITPETIRERFQVAFQREEQKDRAVALRTSEQREIERWRSIVYAVFDDVTDKEECFADLFAHFGRPEHWRCDANADVVLRELAQRGYRLGMASNYDQRLRTVVAGLPALKPLRELVISSEVGWRKPAPVFFEALIRAADMPASNILYVGDDFGNDYEGARAVAMRAVLFDPCRLGAAADDVLHIQDLGKIVDPAF